ncbi:MAG TPA: competence/damage-inducible protein A [Candidatus Paceibacterota bacterium]|nr:competence/damage-inducible protein A [Verrucomicrobiota bacterium]HRY48789.1 competence/damage-inducible protein A [Candidatus Paceibacterota bacterium]HRZ99929.1 competence/damage-inducible protein A [Candidatus Paceibacterota bacterium]
MNIEIINTGTELMLGSTLNTHHQWLARELFQAGYLVTRQLTVADDGPSIQEAAREALGRADLILITGGLGPTSDDLTRELIAALLGKKLALDESILDRISSFYQDRQRALPPSTRVQAMVPEGARVLTNHYGTAPGLAMECQPNPYRKDGRASLLILLPGPPRELHPMFQEQVLPWVKQKFVLNQPFFARILRTTGLGESSIEEKIGPVLTGLVSEGLELGYCARIGQVDLRLIGRGVRAQEVVGEAEAIIRRELGDAIYGVGEVLLESEVVRMLTEKRQTLSLAESCTGGLIAHRITNVPGASQVLLAGFVTYSNTAKTQFLGVPDEIIRAHGAVSEAVARAMAEGARQHAGSDFALAVTGIAGPAGGSAAKPVGTVFIALASRDETRIVRQFNPLDRESFKLMVSQQALNMLRKKILEPV